MPFYKNKPFENNDAEIGKKIRKNRDHFQARKIKRRAINGGGDVPH